MSIIFPPFLVVKLKRGCVGEFRKVSRSRKGHWKYIGKSRTTTKIEKQKIHSIRANENKYVVKLICQPKIWGCVQLVLDDNCLFKKELYSVLSFSLCLCSQFHKANLKCLFPFLFFFFFFFSVLAWHKVIN